MGLSADINEMEGLAEFKQEEQEEIARDNVEGSPVEGGRGDDESADGDSILYSWSQLQLGSYGDAPERWSFVLLSGIFPDPTSLMQKGNENVLAFTRFSTVSK